MAVFGATHSGALAGAVPERDPGGSGRIGEGVYPIFLLKNRVTRLFSLYVGVLHLPLVIMSAYALVLSLGKECPVDAA